jgi:hypothetical protein
MIIAFGVGLAVGTLMGMLSWIGAAAYLESQRRLRTN